MDETTLLEHQIKTVNMVCDSFFGKLAPQQPRKSAEDYAIDYIRSCDMGQIARLLTVIIDVVSDELGCATELEDARDVLRAAIAGDEP